MSTGFDPDHVGGSTASSFSRVAGAMAAGMPPSSASRSTASTPMPPPLVRIASRFPGGDSTRPSVSAQSNNSRKIRHPQHAGAAERGIVDRVRAGQRAGMGRGGLGALRHAAGFDDDDRLDPGGGARRRHEFAGVLDRFDIEQDGARLAVEREIIEQIGDIDVELVADRNDPGKAHARAAPPNPPCRRRWRRTARSAPDFPPPAYARKSSH